MKQKSTDRIIPWPNITMDTTTADAKTEVPLRENYTMSSMSYLDSVEAYPLFEKQARIIKSKGYKGIIDIGCRHGPINKILHEDLNYTDYSYFGFDTSEEPIALAIESWKDYDNINYKVMSWVKSFKVDFKVDVIIFSGVLLYIKDVLLREDLLEDLMFRNQCSNAIIAEPYHHQRHWDERLVLQSITENGLDFLNENYEVDLHYLDLPIFAGKRVIYDISARP
tara:strand:+ start:1902 stop:2573 length:672 start_codon:yes stop_codon:yes gene_type:complete